MTLRVLALMGTGLVDPDAPILTADDLGVLRGDGIFETLLVRGGQPWLPDEHLERLTRSAARLQLDLPPIGAWHDLMRLALSAWDPQREGALKLVCTRGRDITGRPTAYGYLTEVGPQTLHQREHGITAVTATLGVSSAVRAESPWLLGGVKTLSYAVNMAAGRQARSQGADEMIWTSTDGQVLEAPTATVVWAAGDVLATVPVETGILAGTTVGRLLAGAASQGLRAEVRPATVADLHAADGLWLVSSVRTAAAVRMLDGQPRGDGGLTGRVVAALGLPPAPAPAPRPPGGQYPPGAQPYPSGAQQYPPGAQQYPPQGLPAPGYPGQPYPPQGYPGQQYPPQNYPPQPGPGAPPVDPYGPQQPGGWPH